MHKSGEPMEPDLIPLLDLVLQLVMFFLACANTAKENLSEAVKLPLAQSAKPIADDELKKNELVYVNVDPNGEVRVKSFVDENGTTWFAKGRIDDIVLDGDGNPEKIGEQFKRDPTLRAKRLKEYFDRKFKSRAYNVKRDMPKEDQADEAKVKAEVVARTLIVLRADRDADYRDIYNILSQSTEVGFSRMQIRATMDRPSN